MITTTNVSQLKLHSTMNQNQAAAYMVYATKNYDQFTIMPDNRKINQLHVNRLIQSFKEQYLVSPIIVNQRYEVIDGQHRLEACKATDNLIYYIIVPYYGINEVQRFNANQKNWSKIDFLEMFVSQGKEPYIQFKQFMEDFPELDFLACESILTGRSQGTRNKSVNNKTVSMRDFQNGLLSIPNLSLSYKNAKKLIDFKPFYSGYSRRAFVVAVLPLFKSKVYDHKEMIYKLSIAPKKLEHEQNASQYRIALEDIYNWKRLKENKVSFKYE